MNYKKLVNSKALFIESKTLLEKEVKLYKGEKPKLALRHTLTGPILELIARTDNEEIQNYFIKLHINDSDLLTNIVKISITVEISNNSLSKLENLEELTDNKNNKLSNLKQLLEYYNSKNNLEVYSTCSLNTAVSKTKHLLTVSTEKNYSNNSSVETSTIKELLEYTKEIMNDYLKENIVQ